MPKFPTGGKIRVSLTPPPLNLQNNPIETEVKYYGLIRDEALFDVEEPAEALAEVLKDIQSPDEASVEGVFTQQDLEIIDGVTRYNLKNEDFSILINASLNAEDESGNASSLVNPRQRVADRIKQLEFFAGRGTVYQGQGTTMFKYVVPTTERDGNGVLYSHTNPPLFYTESIDSTVENSSDFVPSTPAEVENTHRVGYIENGIFIPAQENEYWWSGEYNRGMRERAEYGPPFDTSFTNPKFPIVRDGNLSFNEVTLEGITVQENWGLRFDTWFKKSSIYQFGRFAVQTSGHVRIDFFEKTGYDSNGGITGSWKVALDTTDPSTYFIQETKESTVADSTYGYRRYFIQGGPSTNYAGGTGVKPNYATRASAGGVFDYSQQYVDREGNLVNKFNDEYVPVVIRFWYGQKDPSVLTPTSTQEEILLSAPTGPASLVLDHIIADGYANWNDYSSVVKFAWNSTSSAWETTLEGTDTTLVNFNESFEVYAYKLQEADPDGVGVFNLDNWDISTSYIGGVRVDGTNNQAQFTIPGFTPVNDGDPVWVVIRNRPWSGIPGNSLTEELWTRYLFDPSIKGTYQTAQDMLEGVGANYVEPDPAKLTFDENFDYYKSKFGQLPALDTYGPDRYDGMIKNEITSSAGTRDYDYDHQNLLFIGRQKKGTVAEIGDGTTNPNKVGKNLVAGEVRNKGENYTFINVISDQFGNGGNVIINAYPSNDAGVLSAGNTGTYGKTLNLSDNTQTYNNPNRQNIQNLSQKSLPATGFDTTLVAKIHRISEDNFTYIYQTAQNGTTYDISGVISSSDFGAGGIRNHDVKTAFLSGFRLSNGAGTGAQYYFYGLVGGVRPSQKDIQLTTEPASSLQITDSLIFPNIIGNNSYQGTLVEFKSASGGAIIAVGRVTSYDSLNSIITLTMVSGTLAAGTTYYADVWYNFIKLPGIPDYVVDSSGVKTNISVLPDQQLAQFYYVYNGSYQYSRVDNGSGLSFSETLFVIGDDSTTTEERPFQAGTETPAPPAEIVTPFGYDNSTSAADPGLGGLCYPPYNTQSADLINTVKTDSALYAEAEGNFDIWWGSRNDLTTLGGNYLEITNKLIFDFDKAQRTNILSSLANNAKPDFIGASTTPYSHKLEVELNVEIPPGTANNDSLYLDVQKHSNNKPVKDRYFLFINKNGSDLEVLTANKPTWT